MGRLSAPLLILLSFCLARSSEGRTVRVTLLATTDLHGHIYPYDYYAAQPANRGLAKIATLIAAERRKAPDALLIDCGDTIQGTPLESVWHSYVRTGKLPFDLNWNGGAPKIDPMMLVMNHVRYDAMVVGNHEFNFGLENLRKAREAAKFPWLAANTVVEQGHAVQPFAQYIVKTVNGIKVAVIGVTTPAVPSWEKPENYSGYRFLPPKEAVASALQELRRLHQPELVIVAVHAGLDRDLGSGAARANGQSQENNVYQIATEVPGIDAIVFGHTHREIEDARVNGVLLVQPKNWGMSLGKLEFTLASLPSGNGYEVKQKSGRLIPVTGAVAADPGILRLAAPYHQVTERYLNSVVAQAAEQLDAAHSRIEDTAIIDAVHQVQLHYAKADVSFTAPFNLGALIRKGPVTVREMAALYIYDNELYAVQGTGRVVREALENAAGYFNTCPDSSCANGPLINRNALGYNFDVAQGVSYEIDLTGRPGNRIRNLRFRGKPLEDDQPLRLAINNYRAQGSAGYGMFRNLPVVWRSYEDIRDLIVRYYATHALPAKPDQNWRVVPQAAHQQLEKEADAARSAAW